MDEITPPYTKVYMSAIKLRGLAHLIECQDQPQSIPDDIRAVYWGISLIIQDLSEELRKAAEEVEHAIDGKLETSKCSLGL